MRIVVRQNSRLTRALRRTKVRPNASHLAKPKTLAEIVPPKRVPPVSIRENDTNG